MGRMLLLSCLVVAALVLATQTQQFAVALKSSGASQSQLPLTPPRFVQTEQQVAADDEVKSPAEDCMEIPFTTCIGDTVVLPPAHPKSLVGYWTFDDAHGHDTVGGEYSDPAPVSGPARGGIGQSASFNGTNHIKIPHNAEMETSEFTLMFWVYLLKGDHGIMRTLVSKNKSPSVQLWNGRRRLHVSLNLEGGDNKITMDSVAVLPLMRWTHVAVIVQGMLAQIYVNGIKDSQVVAPAKVMFNRAPMFVGGHPDMHGTASFIDDLKFFNAALSEAFLQSESSGAFGSIAPNFVKLGCAKCGLHVADKSCASPEVGEGYHICSRYELVSAGVAVARAQGWVTTILKADQDTADTGPDNAGEAAVPMQYWSAEAVTADDQPDDTEQRLGLCCRD